MRRSILWLAAGLLLAGCGSGPRLYNHAVHIGYSPTEFGYGAGRRDLKTVIRGDPLGLGEEAFAAAVVEALNRHPPSPQPTHFTLEPGESAREAYRAVLLFDAPPGVLPGAICREPPDVPVVETEDEVRVAAAFCRYRGALTRVTGEAYRISGVDDPAFDRLIGQIVLALFPRRDPSEEDDDPRLLLIRN